MSKKTKKNSASLVEAANSVVHGHELEKDEASQVKPQIEAENACETEAAYASKSSECDTTATEAADTADTEAEVTEKQKMVDEVMKKVAQMDEEQLTALKGQLIYSKGPDEVETALSDVEKGISAAPKATAPKATGGKTAITDETKVEGDDEVVVDEDSCEDSKEDAGTAEVKESDDEDEDDIEVSTDEDVEALTKDEEGLSEGFKAKAKTIFEAAVKSKVRAGRKSIHESYQKKLEVETAKIKQTLTEQVDSYLSYLTESWMQENKVAIDSSLRTEIAEGFISSLKNVFAESYIEIPEAKKDLVESLNSNVAKLEDKVKKQNAIIFEQKKKNDQLLRKSILESSAKGLAITQVAKLNDLTKDIPFETAEAFQKKVAVIKESYFGKRNSSAPQIKPSTVIVEGKVSSGGTTEVIVEGQEDPTATLPSDMKRYVAAISRSNR